MSKRLYVGNLAFHSTEDNLRNAFETAGVEVLSIQLMTDRMTGQSRGFGFVEVSDAQAQAAINALHGKDLDGRTLTVNEARERTGGPGGGAAAAAAASAAAAAGPWWRRRRPRRPRRRRARPLVTAARSSPPGAAPG
ncbi:RNA-binding protein [Sorangium cellulosum]|uniref:RNA-binding protein n=1 Tax=Sorangium cellulosum TaxID=56 RepID=A0A4P2R2R3_SORCE|nr:RNA-binding protein [Sorangium cellulosum]AUX36976.1 RNA-binding protein [Sorangium cellulosum]